MKNKTLAAWLAFVGGPWACTALSARPDRHAGLVAAHPTALGLYGIQRVQQFGQDDQYSWF